MQYYILKRLLLMVPTLLGVGALVFFLVRIIPGDACLVRWGEYGTDLTAELLDLCRNDLGIHKPLYEQFAIFLRDTVTLNFGDSLWTGRPILTEINVRFMLSLQLAVMASAVVFCVAVPLGVVAGIRQNTWVDYVIRIVAIGGASMPTFWLSLMIVLGLLMLTQSMTGVSWMPPIQFVPFLSDPLENLAHLFWPTVAVAYRYASVVVRMTRSAVLDVSREDYVRTAVAKGLSGWLLNRRHVLRNAMLPVLTLIGMEFSFFMGELVVVEQVFNLNGLGQLMWQSVMTQDYNMTPVLVMLVVAICLTVNLVVDLLYVWFDPRIRYA